MARGSSTWPGKETYSKKPIVGPDPHAESDGPLYMKNGPRGKVQDPRECDPGLRDGSRTPCVGTGLPTARPWDSEAEGT
jgi:hypothetical protein